MNISPSSRKKDMPSTELKSWVPRRPSLNVSCYYSALPGEWDAARHTAHLCPGERRAVSRSARYSLPSHQRPGAPEQVTRTRTAHLRTEMGLDRSHLSTRSALECLMESSNLYRPGPGVGNAPPYEAAHFTSRVTSGSCG